MRGGGEEARKIITEKNNNNNKNAQRREREREMNGSMYSFVLEFLSDVGQDRALWVYSQRGSK